MTAMSQVQPLQRPNLCVLRACRTVSRSEGEALAARLDCAYFETSAAEDLHSVTTAFGRVLNDVLRLHDRQPALQVDTQTRTSRLMLESINPLTPTVAV